VRAVEAAESTQVTVPGQLGALDVGGAVAQPLTVVLMRYKVLDQLEKPQGRVRCEVAGPAPIGTGVDVEGDLTGHVELSNTGKSVVARGHVAGQANLECSRCLKQFPWQFHLAFTENCHLRQTDDPAEYEIAQDEEEPIPILDEDVIDLTELIRQLIAVEVPLRPLCRPDCAGLCPECGTDLNQNQCDCRKARVDPRWAKLREMLEE